MAPTTFKRRYGLDWPIHVDDIFIDLILAKKWMLDPYKYGKLLDPGEHMLRAIRALFTKDQWTISPWTEEHAHAWAGEDFSVWLGGGSTGKAQPLDSEVLTPSGPRLMGSILPGDCVIGLDGKPIVVKSIHDAGERPEYRVVANDGREARCADDHLWTVIDHKSHSRTKTVRARDLKTGAHVLPPHGPVSFYHQPIALDPYILGALLGDGTLGAGDGNSPLSITSADKPLLDLIRQNLPEGYELAFTDRYRWRIVKKSRLNNGKNELIQALKSMELWAAHSYERFIPKNYLFNTIVVRKKLLAGLLDTDGTIGARGDVTYTSTSLQLATDVEQLVRSLGGRASIARKHKSGYKQAGVFIACRPTYNVSISFPDMLDPFLFPGCPHKRARLKTRRCFQRTGISSVQPTGRTVAMKCITVDAPDGLYLTGSFMPTHNSNDAGGLAVLDWITDPTETYIALGSTSIPMLKLRSFESVIRYFRHLKRNKTFLIPGKEAPSQTAIINENVSDEDGEDGYSSTVKASIRGVALAEGDSAKAVARLAGAHLPFVTIILDEGSALPEAAAKARFNAAAGTRRFRFLSLANPISQFDEATKFCIPVKGWDSIDENTPSWRSKFGLVLHHNGFNSPAIVEEGGAEKYPFLINQEQIDRMLKEVGGNADDPIIWTMAKGFPPPQGLESTVLSPVDLTAFNAFEKVVWNEGTTYVEVAGLDPAFTSGGDACILQRAKVGVSVEGLHTISFYPAERIPILASAPRPGAYQAVDGALRILHANNVPVSNTAVDDSGTQSCCDIMKVESGVEPIRCNFAAKATPPPAGAVDADGRLQQPRFSNMVTEIWHTTAAFVRENQVRNMPAKAAEQFCSRRYRKDITPLALERKAEYKKRHAGQKSPDEGDALSLCVLAATRVAGMVPGQEFRPSWRGDTQSSGWGRKGAVGFGFGRFGSGYAEAQDFDIYSRYSSRG